MTDPGTDSLPIAVLRAALESRRTIVLPTRGISMFPFLQEGDLVHVNAVPFQRLALGDIVAFCREGSVVVHRFAGKVHSGLETWMREKGDNLQGFTLVPQASYLGRVDRIETARGARDLRHGASRVLARIHGCRAWLWCFTRGLAVQAHRRIKRIP